MFANTENKIDQFILLLKDLNEIIGQRAKLNLLDNAVLAENFYKGLLNKLFGYELENLNVFTSNFEAIDLIDKNRKLVVQVSCSCTNQKIRETLIKDELKKSSYSDYHLYFVFVGIQNNNVKKGKYTNETQLIFNPNNHIFLSEDLISQFVNIESDEQDDIIKFFKNHLTEVRDLTIELSKKQVCERLLDLMDSNQIIFNKYGPHSKLALNSPLSESSYKIWNLKKQEIIANNKEIWVVFCQNKRLFTREERKLFQKLKLNIYSFELNNISRLDSNVYEPFPDEIPKLLETIIANEGVILDGKF